MSSISRCRGRINSHPVSILSGGQLPHGSLGAGPITASNAAQVGGTVGSRRTTKPRRSITAIDAAEYGPCVRVTTIAPDPLQPRAHSDLHVNVNLQGDPCN